MKYYIKSMHALCSLDRASRINGHSVDMGDFVVQYDHSPEIAEDYSCGNMQADVIPATQKVLEKYGITLDEYNEVANEIADKVSFGCCGWCS